MTELLYFIATAVLGAGTGYLWGLAAERREQPVIQHVAHRCPLCKDVFLVRRGTTAHKFLIAHPFPMTGSIIPTECLSDVQILTWCVGEQTFADEQEIA